MNGAEPISGFDKASSGFGPRVHPVTGELQGHKGIDIPANVGTPVYAAQSGTVVLSGKVGNYGNVIYINHPK